MAGWVGALSQGSEDNWQICKRRGMWGTPSPSGGGVERGDELFIWQAGAGWLARCKVLSPARAPLGHEEVPWPEPQRYRYIFDIEVLHEARRPVWMSGRELMTATGLHTIRLAQFPRLEDALVLDRLRQLLGGAD